MKFTFTRKTPNEDYEDFKGNDGYYTGYGDGAGEYDMDDGVFGSGSLHTQDPEAEAPKANAVALKIVNPKGYEDAPAIADFLLEGNTVLLNVEGLERAQAVRLLDYLTGATRMVGGIMTRVGKTTIVVAPKSVDVSSIEAMVGSN